jgi:uncharacterized protein
LFRTTSKDTIFYDLFIKSAETIYKSAIALDNMMKEYTNVEAKIASIKELEHDGDIISHQVFNQIHKSFITPIDREDIYLIARETDNIIDEIENCAHRFSMYNVTKIRPEAIEFCTLIVEATNELKVVMAEMKNLKRSKILREKIIEINRIENVGDDLYRRAITDLFHNEKDTLEVIKWKGIYKDFENALDACEEVANIVEGVVTKHA